MNVDSNSGTEFVDTFGDIDQDSENGMDVADLVGDFDEPLNEDAMVSSLMMAGVNKTKTLSKRLLLLLWKSMAALLGISHWYRAAISTLKVWMHWTFEAYWRALELY